MQIHERLYRRIFSFFADEISDINREKVAGRQKSIDGFEADVIGIDKILPTPVHGSHSRVGFSAHTGWLAVNDVVLAIAFVPNGNDLYAEVFSAHKGR